jgi:hypothetical protein
MTWWLELQLGVEQLLESVVLHELDIGKVQPAALASHRVYDELAEPLVGLELPEFDQLGGHALDPVGSRRGSFAHASRSRRAASMSWSLSPRRGISDTPALCSSAPAQADGLRLLRTQPAAPPDDETAQPES